MRAAGLALAAAMVALGGASPAPGDEPKKDKDEPKKEKSAAEKLVGTWEWVKGAMPAGSTLELTRDGKFKLTSKRDGKDVFTASGTYTADAESLKLKGTVEGRDVTTPLTITKLTETELVTQDERRRTDELKKAK
jgi:uncharacterized protein (TIGR03066 family)